MSSSEKQRKAVGVYDRPASADRRRGPWIWIALVLLVALAWIAWFALRR
jgi:hypothetical protein